MVRRSAVGESAQAEAASRVPTADSHGGSNPLSHLRITPWTRNLFAVSQTQEFGNQHPNKVIRQKRLDTALHLLLQGGEAFRIAGVAQFGVR